MKKDRDIIIARFLSGGMSPEESAQFKQWVQESPEHERALREAEKFWNASIKYKVNRAHNTELAWEDFKTRTTRQEKNSRRTWVLKAAAALTFIVVLSATLKFLLPVEKIPMTSRTTTPLPAPVATIDSSQKVIVKEDPATKKIALHPKPHTISYTTSDSAIVFLLPDSSKVYLNKQSRLVCSESYGKKERRLVLTGEAFFEVQHLPTPFAVECGNTLIRDIGTSFNIKGLENDSIVEVSVVTGTVEFHALKKQDAQPLTLTAGNSGIYHSKIASFEKARHRKGLKWWKRGGLKNRIKEFFDRLSHKRNQH